MALLLLSACRPGDTDRPLMVAFTDPSDLERAVAEATSVGLTRRDAAGRVVPALARSWRVSNDGRFVIFRLRPVPAIGGRPLTAAEVVRALESAVRPPRAAPTRALLGGTLEAQAPIPEVVEFRLSTPQPELAAVLAQPELAVRSVGAGRRRVAGLAGPLRLEGTAARGAPLRLVPDLDHALPGGPARREVRVLRLDPEAAVERFVAGGVDLVVGEPLRGLEAAARVPERQGRVVAPARALVRLVLNRGEEPLADLRVRQALALALDRARIAAAFDAEPASSLLPPGLSGFAAEGEDGDPPAAPADDREARARALLAEAGFDGTSRRLRVRLAAGRSREETRLIELLATDWARVGVDVVAERRSSEGLRRAVAEGAVGVALDVVESPVAAPTPFLWDLTCGRNRLRICVPAADAWWNRSWQAGSLAERMAAVRAAEREWRQDVAAIPLFRPARWWLKRPANRAWTPGIDRIAPLAHLAGADGAGA
ncbi:ABC transporter substrate-binding protein [Thermaurantiacus sp.]|uniref:ABC transporter substrate-binding protein n=1 Tax=Thermaurantiacus sp. TaxID=2820283 RepID=UPI00298EDAF0|nr:ABC transporter substrate-binding protein [Thermaurantiacus sp.]